MHEHTHDTSTSPLILSASETTEKMSRSAIKLLDGLRSEFRQKIEMPFDKSDRLRWHYLPIDMFPREGVLIKEMNGSERKLAFDLLATGLSKKGYEKAIGIINLETILGEIERSHGGEEHPRNPELYTFSIFGDPSDSDPWSWRVEGHHVSLHFTIVNRDQISPMPSFFGANPAEVYQGDHKGLRILENEEDLARKLFKTLDGDQRSKALFNDVAPSDILTRETPKVEIEFAEGIAMESLETDQRKILAILIEEYIDRLPDQLAEIERQKLRHADLNSIHFAWAGGADRGQPHYYRIHGKYFFVEYDNVQNNANHIHSIWRHLEDDFGFDLLRQHHQNGHSE